MHTLQGISVLLAAFVCVVHSDKILGIVHMPAYSHFQLGDTIFRELAARGHEVTVISPFELKKPVKNLKHVVITGFKEEIEAIKADFFNIFNTNLAFKMIWTEVMATYFTETVLKHTNVQSLLESNEQFDLVIYENFLCDAFSGFADYYKTPYVLINPIGTSRWSSTKMGNPSNPAYVQDHYLSYPSTMSFWQRLHNSLVYVAGELIYNVYTYRKQNELLQKYFPGAPELSELLYNSSLMLVNSHPSISSPVPLVPNMIEIGGYHIQPPKALPKDLRDFLDSAEEGVVYFSMGSNIKSKDLPEDKRNAILGALGQLKEKVLWKWEEDVLPGQPPNVKIGTWLPQQDILAHPNVKLFITHGGLLSTIEAIYHGVPILGIPVFGDQELNMENAQQTGYGIGVPFTKLTEAALSAALREMLNNKIYHENVMRRSKILHDQQSKPLDRAIYWIEYVMRHQGAPHLRTAALSLSWYQYLLLDVVVVVVVGLWIATKILGLFCCKCGKKTVSRNKKRN